VVDATTESESNGGSGSETPTQFDVLQYDDGTHRAVPAGAGQSVVMAHESEVRQRRLVGSLVVGVLPVVAVVGYGSMSSIPIGVLIAGGFMIGVVASLGRYLYDDHQDTIPHVVATGVSARVVDGYVENFEPEAVSDPFE